MIDLITIAFREELDILKVQAQSVDLYCQNLNPTTIYVIVNDEPDVVDLIDPNWWGSLAPKVKILHRSIFSITQFHGPHPHSGWIDQQLLKLLGASISYNAWSWVLDAKTVIVRPMLRNELVFSSTISRQKVIPVNSTWDGFQEILQDLFQIELKNQLAPAGVPFIFHNNTVRELISAVTKLTNKQFHEWFFTIIRPSEFLLYAAYLEYRDGRIDDNSITNSNNNWTTTPSLNFINICHSQIGSYNHLINNMTHQGADVVSISIHRRHWNTLTNEQKQKYRDFLISRNITAGANLL